MNTNTIGVTIARLRRERQIKQEELANFVGVSVQAVSKWENGGMPDVELLPKIADFFHVSIDTLFSRDVIAAGSLWNSIYEAVHSVPAEEEMDKVMKICVLLVNALGTNDPNAMPTELSLDEETAVQTFNVKMDPDLSIAYKSAESSYFLHFQSSVDLDTTLFKNKNYAALFHDLADEPFFEAVRFLMTRKSKHPFTTNLLTTRLGFSDETTENVLEKLENYSLIEKEDLEIDDDDTILYKSAFAPTFTALLNFAKELPGVSTAHGTGGKYVSTYIFKEYND